MNGLWSLLTILGPVALGAVMLWAVLRNRQTPREEARTEAATRELYDEQAEDDRKRDAGEL